MFSKHILNFYNSLESDWNLPDGVELIYPFNCENVLDLLEIFCNKYYKSTSKRYFLFGINPGRFGAGLTGIPFTDGHALLEYCKIKNDIEGQKELSSIFIYDLINAYGGVKSFYNKFYIASICPQGFVKNGKNYNYYDDKKLLECVEPQIVNSINVQTSKYCKTDKAYSLGKGKNYKYFLEINEKYKWFDEIIPLPHPRWVMQYKRKSKGKHILNYLEKLKQK